MTNKENRKVNILVGIVILLVILFVILILVLNYLLTCSVMRYLPDSFKDYESIISFLLILPVFMFFNKLKKKMQKKNNDANR